MLKGYKVHVIRVEGGVGGGKYLKKCVYTSMIKEVMVECLTGRDRMNEWDGRDSINIHKFSLLIYYMMIL